MTIHVSGQTFEHRDILSSLGGWFNREHKRWEFERLTDNQLAMLRTKVGLMINVIENKPKPNIIGFDLSTDNPKSGAGKTNLYGDDPTYFNHFAPQNPAAFFGFSSIGKIIDYIEKIAPSQSDDYRRSGWETDAASWHGSPNMRSALRTAREGWQKGADAATELISRLALENPRVRRRAATVAGGSVNVGRMLAGDPRHMTRRPKLPGKKRITFFVELGCMGTIEPETLIVRAALIGAMIDVMENRGYSASIVATDTSVERGIYTGVKTVYQMAVVVKEHGERLNLMDVMFALGHPSFLRRFSFAICSSVDETREIWGSQGSPSNAFTDDYRCGKNEFYVPVFTDKQQRAMTDDPFSILPFITPDGLPIELKEQS